MKDLGGRKVSFGADEGLRIETHDPNREWRTKHTLTGWRLAFRDLNDEHWTNAGLHPSYADAERAALSG